MLSFRVPEEQAEQLRQWAETVGVERSELLRDALHRELVRLRVESEVRAVTESPPTEAERSLAEIADWGPSEDWSDWTDAAG